MMISTHAETERRPGWPVLATAYILAALLSCATASSASADHLTGCWEGTWHGCTDGLEGTVKATITKCCGDKYHAVFRGRAFKIMPYKYEAVLIGCTDPSTGVVSFRCTTKLPIWGCYWMKGSANGCQFSARYNTDDHVGYFTMKRVCCCGR